MRQQQFKDRYQEQWQTLEDLLNRLEKSKKKERPTKEEKKTLPDLYRDICQHLSIAQSRCYSPGLIQQLQHLTSRAHHQIYKREFKFGEKLLHFFAVDFPVTLRNHAKYFWAACLMFYGPAIVFGILCFNNPDMIYTLMDETSVAEMEYMYNPEGGHQIGRTEEYKDSSRVVMFGFYIYNNTSIGFQTFAGGMLAGLGTLFYLVFNGLVLGGVAGHLTQLGYSDTFWSFVVGHGSFELTAIAVSGTAGFILAQAILAPGNLSRLDALKANAKEAITIIAGAGIMFFIAALIEGFWSPSPNIPNEVKYTVGAFFWGIVIFYLLFAGRKHNAT